MRSALHTPGRLGWSLGRETPSRVQFSFGDRAYHQYNDLREGHTR